MVIIMKYIEQILMMLEYPEVLLCHLLFLEIAMETL